MGWQLDKNRPICPQIEEQICVKIAQGGLKPNERLLSVRDVALEAGVNPNTVQKAFKMLEARGLIYSERSSGWFVSDTAGEVARQTAAALMDAKTAAYFADMAALGVSAAQVKEYVKEWESHE